MIDGRIGYMEKLRFILGSMIALNIVLLSLNVMLLVELTADGGTENAVIMKGEPPPLIFTPSSRVSRLNLPYLQRSKTRAASYLPRSPDRWMTRMSCFPFFWKSV